MTEHDMSSDESMLRALRFVLVSALDRETAARCMGGDAEVALSLWPSSLYTLLAAAAGRSSLVWRRCARLVDASLEKTLPAFDTMEPAELLEVFAGGPDMLDGQELASLLWSLLRRSDPALAPLVARLGAELEVVATQRLHGRPQAPRETPAEWGHALAAE